MIIVVHTTTANMNEAEKIANALIEKRFAACVNMKSIKSIYKWKGKIEEEGEIELSIKTTSEMLESVKNTIISMHTYELPALIWWAVEAEKKYAEWIRENIEK
ncbi:MAG: divalent-cation tolerance protein CutA [Methanomethylovorans sp.]|nr:divalent-cation tolerance protein CutA [Methanomethylovorans sp.]